MLECIAVAAHHPTRSYLETTKEGDIYKAADAESKRVKAGSTKAAGTHPTHNTQHT